MQSLQNVKTEREFDFSGDDFKFLSALAYEKTGIVLSEQKKDMVYGRLARRLRALGLSSFTEYCKILEADSEEEMVHLVNAITTNLTSFFRENHHFDHLRDNLDKNAKRIRIWSAACSAGMEPYSIAMVLKSTLGNSCDAKILATDIDSNMLAKGTAGEYAVNEFEHIPTEYRKYVNTSGNQVVMDDSLKQLIAFKQLNLLEGWPMKGPFDAIFCRNVMIYFDKETKQKLVDRLADLLKPGGWLYIGHSENMHGISDRFELAGRTIYRRVK